MKTRIANTLTAGFLGVTFLAAMGLAQKPVAVGGPDAGRTREEFTQMLDKYPPNVRAAMSLDPTLLTNKEYLAPYPALASYLTEHPEVAHDPLFYVGRINREFRFQIESEERGRLDRGLEAVSVFGGFGMAIGLLTWLIRTLIDYRRWHRIATVQTNVHTKLLDRFNNNEDLIAYIQSPAGAKFLESSPISIDGGQRSMGAPLGRILWSVQAGLVVGTAGLGLQYASSGLEVSAAQTLHVFGIIGTALGIGFLGSALVSFFLSSRMGLLETRSDSGNVQG